MTTITNNIAQLSTQLLLLAEDDGMGFLGAAFDAHGIDWCEGMGADPDDLPADVRCAFRIVNGARDLLCDLASATTGTVVEYYDDAYELLSTIGDGARA